MNYFKYDGFNKKIVSLLKVQQLFSNVPLPVIIDDLRVTRSVELTIENILDGRLVTPTIYREPEPAPAPTTPTTLIEPTMPATTSKWEDFTVTDHTESLET